MHEQQAVPFLGRKRSQAETALVDIAKVFGLRHTNQRATGVVGPRMKWAGKASCRAALLSFNDDSPMTTRVNKCLEGAVVVARCQDGNSKVVVRQERARFWKVARQPNALRRCHEELIPLALRPRRIGIGGRRQAPKTTGVFGGARVEMGAELFDQTYLLIVSHI